MMRSVAILIALTAAAHGRDLGQWGDEDPAVRAWYESLRQPDNPIASCCGKADAYWCDDLAVRNGKATCVITDDRPDEPRRRPHVDVGTIVEIPEHKLMREGGNPTGHGVVFMTTLGHVFCYVQGGGA